MRPFYKNLKVGDKVIVKKTNEEGKVIKLLPNPYIQLFWQYPNYLVIVDFKSNLGEVFQRKELRLIK